MKRIATGLTLLGLAFTTMPTARADEKSHRQAATELLEAMNFERQLDTSITQMLQMQVKANPQLAPFREVMKKFLTKHMSWASLKDEMVAIYAEAFTEDELKEITVFYKSPAGKKLVDVLPQLMSKGMQLGVSRVQQNTGELQQMIEDAKKKQ